MRAQNVKNLKRKRSFAAAGGITVTPTVEQGGLYVPDWASILHKINPDRAAP